MNAYVVRTKSGDKNADSEAQILEWLNQGRCAAGDFVYSFASSSWGVVCELPGIAPTFASKPELKIEKLVIYVYVSGAKPYQAGPFSVSEVRAKIAQGELGPSSWIFIEKDTEWRQVKAVKALKESIPALPHDKPNVSPVAAAAVPAFGDASPDDLLAGAAEPLVGSDFVLEDAQTLPEKKLGPATNPVAPFSFSAEKEAPSISLDMGAATPGKVTFTPAPPGATPAEPASDIKISLGSGDGEQGNQIDDGVSYEERTQAISALGLSSQDNMAPGLDTPPPPPGSAAIPSISLDVDPPKPAAPAAPMAPPKIAPPVPPSAPPMPPPAAAAAPAMPGGDEPFDGVTAEIPTDPIWLIKAGTSENAMGPFRFLEVIKYLTEGKINKNDKISRVGTNRFCKIAQQYEFNVKYTLENVVEGGVEKQKIFIRRRHPRVPYMADVQIQQHGKTVQATCVNISSGGILVEAAKATFALGETLTIRILPGLIHQTIACDTLVIGKVPKIPPGYALKFKDLKQSDKEAIDFFVQETLKKEQ